ncbi:MAG: hypothetical protein ACREMY_23455, partial [bacterium]
SETIAAGKSLNDTMKINLDSPCTMMKPMSQVDSRCTVGDPFVGDGLATMERLAVSWRAFS